MSATVPDDMWWCCYCKQLNLIATAPEKCPPCSHTRCTGCAGPGQAYPESNGLFTDRLEAYPSPQDDPTPVHSFPGQPPDTWYCSGCGTLNGSWVDTCPVCGTSKEAMEPAAIGSFRTLSGAGQPAPGAWVCQSCGSANCDLTPDFCGACGATRG